MTNKSRRKSTGKTVVEEIGTRELAELRDVVELQGRRPDLIINRVPKDELRLFKKIAKHSFNGDYGMLLKFLLQYYIHDEKWMDLLRRVIALESIVESGVSDNVDATEEIPILNMLDGTSVKLK